MSRSCDRRSTTPTAATASSASSAATARPASPARPAALAAALVIALLAWPGLAAAHQASIAHSTVRVQPGQAAVEYELVLSAASAAEILALPQGAPLTAAQVERGQPALLAYAHARIAIGDGAHACAPAADSTHVRHEPAGDVVLAWRMDCPRALATLVLDYQLFFDRDPLHRGLARIQHGDQAVLAELTAARRSFAWELGAPPPATGLAFVQSGVEHIVFGFDHIAFLLALLLAVAVRRPPGMRAGWEIRGLGQSWRRTALIVTSFTIAHSLTLIAASLGWITLDARLVECVIAASIVFVAVENILRPDAPHRSLITFGFGLMHGLGFASMLAELLPPSGVVAPLLLFNAGVELGQLAIVVVLLPLLALCVRLTGARTYRLVLLPFGSAVLATLGALWLVERLFEITILGF